MADDAQESLNRIRDAVRRGVETLSAGSRALHAAAEPTNLLARTDHSREVLRALLGPMEDVRRIGNAASSFASEFERLRSLIAEHGRHRRLLGLEEAAMLLCSSETEARANALDWNRNYSTELRSAIAAMTTPWLDIQDTVRSFSAFCELQGIGRQLLASPAFDTQAADRLRLALGDWRDRIEWPSAIFTDPLARTDFYVERGLDPALTDFPVIAFDQSVTIAGLKSAPPPFVARYYCQSGRDEGDEETGFARTNAAHDRLQRFETQIRRFIDKRMQAAFGENWITWQVPGSIREEWRHKELKARDTGEPERPLLAYADFTDYEKIIVRGDNWKQAFAAVFKRRTLVQESFQRLYPIRVCTMHARLITQDDELYLYAETKRLLTAIDSAP
ncbi:MAG: Swt1 family HEPN domain-containing protein [Bryobacterales bacterium]|nr:Swt1 family HEPN domain-containing protein [Bryobacterales bacterium]